MSETPAEKDALACDCGHGVWWHHDTRGCGYLGFTPQHRCTCRLLAHQAVASVMARAWDEGYDEGADDTFDTRDANPYREESA